MRRMMFRLFVICALALVAGSTRCMAQTFDIENGSGIYLTESDFQQNKVTLYAKADSQNYLKRSLDDVIVMRNGNKYKLCKGSFFGYLQQGNRYRFYQNDGKFLPSYGYYKIEEESSVVIYSKESSTPKTGTHTFYYYSETVDAPIKRLSLKALKNVSDEAYPTMLKYTLTRTGKNLVRFDD